MPVEFYKLKREVIPDPDPQNPRIVTAALLRCGLCGNMIDSMGGPGDGAICIPCGDLVRRGVARGAVVWGD